MQSYGIHPESDRFSSRFRVPICLSFPFPREVTVGLSVRRRRSRRLLATTLFAGVLAFAAYAFTASNTIPGSQAGDGSNAISGYTASAVTYTINSSNPQNLDQLQFTINPTTTAAVKVRLAGGGTWYSCSNSSGTVTCDTTVGTQATVAGASNLTVVAVQ
jgi:hypothetical protein